jgi:hypothetical protein
LMMAVFMGKEEKEKRYREEREKVAVKGGK